MNNKGQTLVLFILLLPLLFLFCAMVLEAGNALIMRRQIDSEIRQALKYGLTLDNNTNDEIRDKMYNLLTENLGTDIDVDIRVATSDINVTVVKKYQFLFPFVVKQDYALKRDFRGYVSNDEVKIEKE